MKNPIALKIIGLGLFAVAFIFVIAFFIRGQVTIDGDFPENQVSESLSCERQDTGYFLFNDTRILEDATNLTLIFDKQNLRLASLIYTAFTENATTAQNVEAAIMSELNTNFGTEFGFNGLGANFTSSENKIRMSLTATTSEMGSNGKKYFLIDGIQDQKDKYYEELTRRGFNCKKVNYQD